jgi:DUF3011 family protein/beta/gamma crystallin
MKPTLREVAIFAVVMMLTAIVLLVPARSVAGNTQQGGGLSITFGVGQQPGSAFTLTCESRSSRRVYCAADTRGGATLQQQFPGSAPCVFGDTWGADGAGIWVQHGCRASFIVNPYTSGPWWWDSGNGHRPPSQGIPRKGACFFKEKYYRGEYFCMARGSSFNLMPPGFNDAISSIKVYGRVTVTIYKNADFQSDNASLNGSVPDLAAWRLPSDRSRNWNNKISSIQIN